MSPEKVLEQIDEQRTILIKMLNMAKKTPLPPNRLSDVCTKLAILNGLLGGFVAQLKSEQLVAEREAYDRAKKAGGSDTKAIAESRWGTIKERERFTKIETAHKDLWKLISMAQSHIRAEGQEQKS